MKKLALVSVGLWAAAGSVPAAADGPSWTGPYAGVTAGVRLTDTAWETTCLQEGFPGAVCPHPPGIFDTRFVNNNPADFDTQAERFGGFAGWQLRTQQFVLGGEADLAYAHGSRRFATIPGASDPLAPGGGDTDSTLIETDWDGSHRVRAGVLVTPATLLYATAGISWMRVTYGVACGDEFPDGWCSLDNVGVRSTTSSVLQGFTWGGGVETVIAGPWIFRLDYRHSDYDSLSHIFLDGTVNNADAISAAIDTSTDTLSVGIGVQF